MYNSRPRGFKGGFAVPENYSGNAFSDEEEIVGAENSAEVSETIEENIKDDTVRDEVSKSEASVSVGAVGTDTDARQRSCIGFNVGKLFRGGIGFEELLIIALILLISQNDNNDDIIVLLALLLFVS